MEPVFEELSEDESLALIAQAQVGRIGFTGRYGPVVLPVNFKLLGGAIVIRTEQFGTIGEDLRTGIAGAEYKVAFEVDDFDPATRTGWSVLVQGGVHHVDDEAERDSLLGVGVEPWAGGEKALFLRISPTLVTGRRISRGQLAKSLTTHNDPHDL
jgi:nitroimidazol reductase NimA-like FMN-containing flavoprotein (pyridoxamine 5'-phosphate oxidase superfamily)